MRAPLFWSLFKQSLAKIFSYRVNFWINFWGSAIIEILIAYALWFSVFEYQQVKQIGGYSFEQMMLYYLLVSFIGRVVRGTEHFEVSTDIYEGNLTRYLLYPHNYFKFKYAEQLGYTAVGVVQSGVAITLFYYLFPQAFANVQLSFVSLPVYLLTIWLASVFYFLVMTLLELVAFWADNVWSLLVMARFAVSFLGGLYLPLSLFPEAMQQALTYTPFPALTYLPISYLMGGASFAALMNSIYVLLFWILILSMMMAFVWGRGKYRFSGIGQ